MPSFRADSDPQTVINLQQIALKTNGTVSSAQRLAINTFFAEGRLAIVVGTLANPADLDEIYDSLDDIKYAVGNLKKYCEVEVAALPTLERIQTQVSVAAKMAEMFRDLALTSQTLKLTRNLATGQRCFELEPLQKAANNFVRLWNEARNPNLKDGTPKTEAKLLSDKNRMPDLEAAVCMAATLGLIAIPKELGLRPIMARSLSQSGGRMMRRSPSRSDIRNAKALKAKNKGATDPKAQAD